jgi:hypothetical protein
MASECTAPALASKFRMGFPGMKRGIIQSMVTARKNVRMYISNFLTKYRLTMPPAQKQGMERDNAPPHKEEGHDRISDYLETGFISVRMKIAPIFQYPFQVAGT